jgi:hypothetical protein
MPENTRGIGARGYKGPGGGPDVIARGSAAGTLDPMSYSVRTPVFEGPFDLLLHLILKQEVELWEVSLSEIVDAYISELERM